MTAEGRLGSDNEAIPLLRLEVFAERARLRLAERSGLQAIPDALVAEIDAHRGEAERLQLGKGLLEPIPLGVRLVGRREGSELDAPLAAAAAARRRCRRR